MEPLEAEELAKKIVSLGMTVKDAAATKKPKSTQTQIKPKNRALLNIEESHIQLSCQETFPVGHYVSREHTVHLHPI